MILALFAAWAADPLVLGDPNGVSVKPGLLLNARVTSTLTDEPDLALQVQRFRPNLRGTILGQKARFFAQAELAGTISMLDAVVQLQPVPWFEVWAGRFLVPSSRAQLTPVPKLQYHAFAPSTVSEHRTRDVGVQLRAIPAEGRLDARIGVFSGLSDADTSRPFLFSRVSFDVVGKVPLDETQVINAPDGDPGFSIGAAASYGDDLRRTDEAIVLARMVAADAALRVWHIRVQTEGFARNWDDGQTDLGAYLQASVAPIDVLEVGSRFDMLESTTSQWTMQGLVAWYPKGDNLRTTLQYTWQQPDTKQPASQSVAIQQQLWF
ncbi:MAG: hypothetical protein H6737_04630 [Alphaproteobacteria bacterium]|nr:hypothetical protein [Alphaproteobacteria bacterium]